MRQLLILLSLIALLPANSMSQDVSVEKNIWGVQAGIYPLSFYNEVKLINPLSLRSEIGFGLQWSSTNFSTNKTAWAIIPAALIEPRYYYNLNRRSAKGKRIDGNSGNYLSTLFIYNSDFVISNVDGVLFPSISLIPMYGLRRKIGTNFNFEFAFGVGRFWSYKEFNYYDFQNDRMSKYSYTERGSLVGLRLAFGYMF